MKKLLITIFGLILLSNHTFAATADTQLELDILDLNNDELSIQIMVDNPSEQEISSVQAWLEFDPQVLQASKIDTEESPFDFVAPGENNFDNQAGIVKIGRSSISGGVNKSETFVAKVDFARLKDIKTEIKFHNFQLDNSGNTSVRVFQDGFPVNILKERPESLIVDGQEVIYNTKDLVQNSTSTIDSTNTNVQENYSNSIQRPTGLRVSTGDSHLLLAWDKDPSFAGYNLYYSNKSGHYLRRRSVGNTNEYYLDQLENDKTYYLAITGYDYDNKESDYSNEVKITVNRTNSSSAPLLFFQKEQSVKQAMQYVKSGPNATILICSMMSALILFAFKNKKQKLT